MKTVDRLDVYMGSRKVGTMDCGIDVPDFKLFPSKKAGIKEAQASEIAMEIQEKVREHLGKYLRC